MSGPMAAPFHHGWWAVGQALGWLAGPMFHREMPAMLPTIMSVIHRGRMVLSRVMPDMAPTHSTRGGLRCRAADTTDLAMASGPEPTLWLAWMLSRAWDWTLRYRESAGQADATESCCLLCSGVTTDPGRAEEQEYLPFGRKKDGRSHACHTANGLLPCMH